MFNIFKRKEKNNLQFHSIIIKKKTNKNLYIGQFLRIDIDAESDCKYYFSTLDEDVISNKIPVKEIPYCEKYNYGIIRSINGEFIEVLIICSPGYLQMFKIELSKLNYQDGDAFVINNGMLMEGKDIVGKIIDDRYNSNVNIQLNSLYKNKLIVFIQK